MIMLSFCQNHLSLILITLHSEQKSPEVRSYTDKGYPVVADLLPGMPPPLSGFVMVSHNPPFEQVDDVLISANGIDMIDFNGVSHESMNEEGREQCERMGLSEQGS